MSGRYFLDTNILIYTFDRSAPEKRRAARQLLTSALKDGQGVISFQVVGEFLNAAERKFKPPMSPNQQQAYLRTVLVPLCGVHSSPGLHERCLQIHERTKYSIYDSLILAAAAGAGCETLYTEDLQHDQQVDGVRIVSPFL